MNYYKVKIGENVGIATIYYFRTVEAFTETEALDLAIEKFMQQKPGVIINFAASKVVSKIEKPVPSATHYSCPAIV